MSEREEELALERREHRVRLATILGCCVLGAAFVSWHGTGDELGTLVLGALVVLVPALVDSLRHWGRIR